MPDQKTHDATLLVGNVDEGGEKYRNRFVNIPLTPIVADAAIDQLSDTFGDREYLEACYDKGISVVRPWSMALPWVVKD